jgi:ArsR family transcriptional regulator, arsenate/arsenite/antimonite-responsive transcriptional repressor
MRDAPFVKIAKALADPTRHQMLRELRASGELTCSEMCERFALAQPTISHHIKTLEEAGLIRVRKQGQFHVLAVDESVLGDFARDLTPNGKAKRTRKPAARSAP